MARQHNSLPPQKSFPTYLRLVWAAIFFSLTAMIFVYRWSRPTVVNVDSQLGESRFTVFRPRALTAFRKAIPWGNFLVNFQVRSRTNPTWNLFADDCFNSLRVNGQKVDIGEVVCDYRKKFSLTSIPGFVDGVNQVEVEVKNFGGEASLRIYDATFSLHTFFAYLFFALGLWFVCSCGEVAQSLSRFQTVALVVATVYFLYYFESNLYYLNGNDADLHVARIRMFLAGRWVPKTVDCWMCYHSDVYYCLAGAFAKVAAFVFGELEDGLQIFSLICFLWYLIFSFALLNLVIPDWRLRLLGSLFLVLIPSARFHSIRVGNDSLVYSATAAALFYFEKWTRSPKNGSLEVSAFSLVMALFTKVSSAPLIPALILATWFRGRSLESVDGLQKTTRRAMGRGLAIVGFGVILLSAVLVYKQIGPTKHVAQLDKGLEVSNQASDLLRFDPAGFVSAPFADPWKKTEQREFFWDYWLKTALFGEREFFGSVPNSLGTALNFTVLPLLLLFTLGFFRATKKQFAERSGLYSFLIFQTAAAAAFRARYPYMTAGDFRYSYVLIPVFVCFLSFGLEELKRAKLPVLDLLGRGFLLGFCALAFLFDFCSF